LVFITLSLALSLKGEGWVGLLRGVAPLLELPALYRKLVFMRGFAPLKLPLSKRNYVLYHPHLFSPSRARESGWILRGVAPLLELPAL
jgi:hypothetical protein